MFAIFKIVHFSSSAKSSLYYFNLRKNFPFTLLLVITWIPLGHVVILLCGEVFSLPDPFLPCGLELGQVSQFTPAASSPCLLSLSPEALQCDSQVITSDKTTCESLFVGSFTSLLQSDLITLKIFNSCANCQNHSCLSY